MIEPFVEIDGEEVHLQFTDENSHIMLVFNNLKNFLDFMDKLQKQSKELQQKKEVKK